MSTKTNTTAPKPGSLKAAHARIDELLGQMETLATNEIPAAPVFPIERLNKLEELANKPHQCPGATLRALPVARQYTGRVTMPSYGIPLPAGIGFHGYVSTRLKDDVFGDQVLPPSEAEVMDLLRMEADKQFPGHVGVALSDISVLPEGWAAEEE